MAEISAYVSGPYEGVSQAPPQVRLAGSCDSMEDCLAAIPNGVQKRPPFTWGANLKRFDGTAIVVDPFALWVNIPRGDPSLDLTLMLNREAGHVLPYLFLTSSWAAQTLLYGSDATTYLDLNGPVPNRDFRTRSVEDVTFITNRTVPTANDGTTAATRPYEAIVWCKTHGYARKTTVSVTSTAIPGTRTSGFTSGSGSSSNDPLTVGTDKLAKALYDGTDPHAGNDTVFGTTLASLTGFGFTVVLDGSLIYISHPSVDFTIAVADDIGGSGVIPIKGSVQRFSDLPAVAHDGFTVKIAQEAAGGNSDYYVQFVAGSASTIGTWKEVVAPGAPLGLDRTKMPIQLQFISGAWHLVQPTWIQRAVGDATLNPDPDFIGSKIEDVVWWNGRLGFVSDGQVNLSSSANPYSFYTTTLAAALDSDPIGFLPPSDIKTFFKEGVIFDERLVAMGNLGQAIIASSGATTAKSTKITTLAMSEYTDQVRTQAVNHKLYFGAVRGGFLATFEVAIDRISGLAIPQEQTAAVPTYIPNTVDRAATSEAEFITVYAASASSRLYVHVFRHADNQQVQNAWFAWNLPTGWWIAGMYMKGAVIYALLRDTGGAGQTATLDLSPLTLDPSGTILSYPDVRCTEAQATAVSYNAGAGTTTFTLPYPVTAPLGATVRAPVVDKPEGYVPVVLSRTASTVTLQGDWRTQHLWFGYPYASYFTPSQFYKLGADGRPERSGRLTVKRLKIDLARFSYLRAEVSIKGRTTQLVPYNGYNANDLSTPLDTPANQKTVTLSIPVSGKSDDVSIKLVNDTFLGFALLGYEWEASWTPRAQRVT